MFLVIILLGAIMKKILFFLESLSGGGAEKVLSDLVSNLDKAKYDVTVCTVTDGGVYEAKVRTACKYTSFLKSKNYKAGGFSKLLYWIAIKFIYLFPAKWVYRCFIHEKYDVEIAFIEGFATKLIASANTQSKKIAWVHIDMEKRPYADKSYKSLSAQIEAYHKYSKIVCVSNSVKAAFERKFFASKNVIVQYNPVDKEDILRKKKESIDISRPKGLLLGTIGRLERSKGFLRLLECVSKLKGEGYSFYLWIIGEGTQRHELEKYIEIHQLSHMIHLLGFQTNPFKYINQCDAFICSSYAEGFSTAATESLLLGKPIFTVDCAGMRELFGEYVCGMIVENSDADLLAMLRKIVSEKVDLNYYSCEAKQRANAFDIKQRIKDIEDLFEE